MYERGHPRLASTLTANRRVTVQQIPRQFNIVAQQHVSSHTIQNNLLALGHSSHRSTTVPLLTARYRAQHLAWV